MIGFELKTERMRLFENYKHIFKKIYNYNQKEEPFNITDFGKKLAKNINEFSPY